MEIRRIVVSQIYEYSAISCFDLSDILCIVFMWNKLQVLFDANVLQMFVAFVEGEGSAPSKFSASHE